MTKVKEVPEEEVVKERKEREKSSRCGGGVGVGWGWGAATWNKEVQYGVGANR